MNALCGLWHACEFGSAQFVAILVAGRAFEGVRAGRCGDTREPERIDEVNRGGIARIYLGGDTAHVIVLEQVGKHTGAGLSCIALTPEWHKDHVSEQCGMVSAHGRLNSANVGAGRALAERPVQPDFVSIW